jgi:hypothetical protein
MRAGLARVNHATPKEGHATPKEGHATPKEGHATPKEGPMDEIAHYHVDLVHVRLHYVTMDQSRPELVRPPVLAQRQRLEPPDLRPVATDVRGGILGNCGHWMPEEQPAALLAFFARSTRHG